MDQELFKAIRRGDKGKINKFALEKRVVFRGTSPQGNTVLHVAARYGDLSVLRQIITLESSFVIQQNKKGETPLHIATKANDPFAVIDFCEYNKATSGVLLKMKDDEGNTPLHNAVRIGDVDMVTILIHFDKEPILYVNEAGQSPLSIAIDARLHTIARILIKENSSSLDHRGPNQLTLLHTAVLRQDYDIMIYILKEKRELINTLDEHQRNPLHYAAASGQVKMARCLSEVDASLVYQTDINGQSPIHFAAKNGRLSVLKMLLNDYPDAIEVLDEENHNILHIASQHGYVDIVLFILKVPEMEDLINSPDKDGNYPLHLAAKYLQSDVVYILSRNIKVNIRATNKNNHTALDFAERSNVKGKDIQKHLTIKALKAAYADRALDPDEILENRRFRTGIEDIESEGGKGKGMAKTLSLMATLIATFTFTAAFTIPGGYKQNGDDEGMAVLVRRTGFQAFVITDAIAMTSSMTAAVVIFWSFWRSKSESFMDTLPLAIGLTWVGLVSMALAFVTGLFVVLSNNLGLAVVVCLIGLALPLGFYVFAPFISLLFDQSATSHDLSEFNPFAFTWRMGKILLKNPFNLSRISKRKYQLPK